MEVTERRGSTLSPRLAAIAREVPPGCRYADVGTDHGYLPVWLVTHGVVERAIASDISAGPLDRARQTAERAGVSDRISLRLCDGLSAIAGEEAEVISVAGMGGETIVAILRAAPWTAQGERVLLLQPMTAAETLRAFLWENGYRIKREILVKEGRNLYVTMVVLPGKENDFTPAEIWAGKQGREQKDPLRSAYLDKVLKRAEEALAGAERSGKECDVPRAKELGEVCRGLKELKEEWETWQA